ncbi:MAG: DedA family protein [Actinobacteria bacterium]|nr:DedA family protein [Actinomycetota bacterium]
MLLLASITDRLVEVASNVIGDLGLAGVFLLMLPESACIPIPSEATMMFAGYNISAAHHPHSYTLVEVVAVGAVANLLGSWIAYAIGYYGRIDLLEKHGGKLHIRTRHLETADRWFKRHGDATVFFTRMLPIVRTFISLPAGVARMPFWRFSLFTIAGCVPWILMLTVLGQQAGNRWKTWRHSFDYVDYVVLAVIVVGIVYLVVRRRRERARDATPESA